ncbi:MFS transporter [Actinomycetospora sp. NBRC 106378]|jgi:EmrB/QacA subfamily drug resistance transporter|uniref:MFS transporter n=1 Tax=Actinomycetospora sp. NBRC 106378 TaxID=3032208 RepID=UPI0024A1E237|nr:MFS transporter [Actinomycetospora sp. NBRC 106378]GLZ55386.1 MFS transporter [Actinomycetospora sp. NBRC 106378]
MTTADLEAPGTGAPEPSVGGGVGTSDATGPATTPDPRRWPAFIIMTVAVFMDMLDGSVVNVAISTIQRDVGLSYAAVQWVTGGYLLAFALLLITGGRLGDIIGRRRTFLLGVAGFTLASLVCGLAGDPSVLIGARILQGAMAGMMVPQVLAIVHVTFPNEEKGKVFAVHGGVGGIAATIAPLIGALLVAADIFGLDWRPIFLINVPVGIAGLVLGARYIPESRSEDGARLDLPGVVLSGLALLLLMVPLTFGRDLGWPVWGYVSIGLAVVVLALFVVQQKATARRGGAPLLALNLFGLRSFSASLVLVVTMFLFTGMFMLSLYLYMQNGLGWTPLRSGLTTLAFAIGAFVTATASVIVLVPKFGRAVLQVGAVTIAAGVGTFLLVNGLLGGSISTWAMLVPLFVIGLGFGATATPLTLFGLSEVPMRDAGSASGLLNTKQQLGFTLGIAAASLAFFAPLTALASDSVEASVPAARAAVVAAGVPADRVESVVAGWRACTVDELAEASPTAVPATCSDPAVTGPELAAISAQARADNFAGAFEITLYTALALMVVVFVAGGLLPRHLDPTGPTA